MAQFTHSLCDEVIRSEGRCPLTQNEKVQMARLALRTLRSAPPALLAKFHFMLSFIEKDGVPDDTFLAVSVHGIKASTEHLAMAPTVGDLRRLVDKPSAA